MTGNSRGVLLFAENNKNLNYLKLAILSAICIKNNMGKDTKVSVVTNQFSLNWFNDSEKSFIRSLFDKIILTENNLTDTDTSSSNLRVYRDTAYHSVTAQFLNKSRSSAYELSPYEETLLVDVDYFVMNDSLNAVWGNQEEFLINKSAKTMFHKELSGPEFRLNPYGIRMYWATLIYFKKSEKSKLIFDLVDHIKSAWDYYKHVYDFSGALFRNDFAFSIALHMLNGFSDDNDFVKSFPEPAILTALDTDQFMKFNSKSSASFFVCDPAAPYKFYVSKINDVNVHCLNKISILNQYDSTLEIIK